MIAKKKTPIERFQDIKELEVEGENGTTVQEFLPYFCKNVEDELTYASNCHMLEEQLGCPLEVIVKALENGIYTKESELDKELELFEVRGVEKKGVSVISKFCSYAECDFSCYYTDYKKTWWLREDRSE